MKLLILALFIFSGIEAYAGVSIVNKRIILEGPSCAELRTEVNAIWEKRPATPACRCSSTCKIDITDVLPKKISDLAVLRDPRITGPNCWNSVLYVGGFSPGLTESNEELEFWLNSPLCHEVFSNPQPGDIYNFINERGNLDHSMRLISPNLIFNKESFTRLDLYEILDRENYLAQGTWKETRIFRCKRPSLQTQNQVLSRALQELKNSGERLTKLTTGISTTSYFQFHTSALTRLNALATKQLKLPLMEAYSASVLTALEYTLFNQRLIPSVREEILNSTIAKFSLYSQKQMRPVFLTTKEEQALKVFTEADLYAYENDKEFLLWSMVYLNSRTMLEQFRAQDRELP